MTHLRLSALVAAFALAMPACGEAPVDPERASVTGPDLAPPSSSQVPVQVTLASGTDLIPDGKGSYRDGVCGVFAKWSDADAISFSFTPAGSVPKSQTAACTGIPPRKVSLALRVRHLSEDRADHSQDVTFGTSLGTFEVTNLARGAGGGSKINAPPACFLVSRTGKVSGRGLRFDADNYVGSDDLIREDLDGERIRFRSPPNALAWCEDNSGISLWHVVVDFEVQKL